MIYWFDHPYTKVLNDTSLSRKNSSFDVYMARNEYEGCQIVLFSAKDTTVKLSVIADGLDVETDLVKYVEVSKGQMYPDGLVPVDSDTEIYIKQSVRTPVFIRFMSNADTASGIHICKIKISAEEVIETFVNVHVWDFVLPDTPSCQTAFGLYKNEIAKIHKTEDGRKLDELYRKYYEFLLKHKVSAYDIPCDILSEEADKYLNDPRMTSFRIPYNASDDIIIRYRDKLRQNSNWLYKGYFYPLDEPTTMEHHYKLDECTKRLDALFPENNVCTPFFINPIDEPEQDAVELLKDNVNIWCPKSYMYINKDIYTERQQAEDPSFSEKMKQRKAEGDRVWWYVCWEPGDPYCNLFVDMPGIMHRILFWQQKLYDVDGFLYWSSNYWSKVEDPWSDMATVKMLSEYVYGDGSVLYNGEEGPCRSIRLDAIRDGIEDFEYLSIAEKVLGREETDRIICKVTRSLLNYTRDDDEFAKVRLELGNAINSRI